MATLAIDRLACSRRTCAYVDCHRHALSYLSPPGMPMLSVNGAR